MAKHKVLLFEPVNQKGLDHISEHGGEVVYSDGFEPSQIISAVADVDAILARAQGLIDGRVMDAAPSLKVVGRHGINARHKRLAANSARTGRGSTVVVVNVLRLVDRGDRYQMHRNAPGVVTVVVQRQVTAAAYALAVAKPFASRCAIRMMCNACDY